MRHVMEEASWLKFHGNLALTIRLYHLPTAISTSDYLSITLLSLRSYEFPDHTLTSFLYSVHDIAAAVLVSPVQACKS